MDNLYWRPPLYSRLADGISLAGAGVSLFHFSRVWPTLPESARIPMQFDLWGQPTWRAPKVGFLLYPALALGVPLLLRSAGLSPRFEDLWPRGEFMKLELFHRRASTSSRLQIAFTLSHLPLRSSTSLVSLRDNVDPEKTAKKKSALANLSSDLQILLSLTFPFLQYLAAEIALGKATQAPVGFIRTFVGLVLSLTGLTWWRMYKG